MADCPTGVLIEVCSDPTPPPAEKSKRTLNELLSELGVKYSLASEHSNKWTRTKQSRNPSPLISEDDFITNEVFDFKVPAFDELDFSECDEKKNAVETGECPPTFEFPLLSIDVLSENTDWNTEVLVEANKISKRISMQLDLPVFAIDSDASSIAVSSADLGNRSYTVLSSAKSSDGDDSVFFSPPKKRNLTSVPRGKENGTKRSPSSSSFVPHPNPAEAMTPEDVRKIKGPLQRRGTFTLDKISSTPKTASRLATPGNNVSRRFGQDITQATKVSTPKSAQRSQSLCRTPEVTSRISTFRKGESPEIAQRRRSSSLGRPPPSLSNTNMSSIRPLQFLPPKPKVGGPSPLLRRALVPNAQSRPMLVKSSNITRGPIKATGLGTGKESQRLLNTTAARSTLTQSRVLKPKP